MDVKQEWGDNISIGYNYNALQELKIIWWSHEKELDIEERQRNQIRNYWQWQFWWSYHEFYGLFNFHVILFKTFLFFLYPFIIYFEAYTLLHLKAYVGQNTSNYQ